jgi:hypothetical protein
MPHSSKLILLQTSSATMTASTYAVSLLHPFTALPFFRSSRHMQLVDSLATSVFTIPAISIYTHPRVDPYRVLCSEEDCSLGRRVRHCRRLARPPLQCVRRLDDCRCRLTLLTEQMGYQLANSMAGMAYCFTATVRSADLEPASRLTSTI